MVMAVPEEVRNKIVGADPHRRLGEPDEIAYAVAFFLPDEAGWITGANLSANGGSTWAGDSGPARAGRN
jgi:acetoacetyl-CoA reductase